MERNKKFTEASISNEDYLELFEELTKCGEHVWVQKGKKKSIDLTHPKYPNYSRLDFRHLFKFFKVLVGKDKQRKKNFQAAIAGSGITWNGFRQGQYRNLNPYLLRSGIYVAAEFLDIALIQLLADFLVDCENDGKKIRLAEHARYEKTIKSFIREAPELVKRLEVESAQISTQGTQGQSPEQTFAETRHRIERVEGQKKWLSPCNYDALPLAGRKKEVELLDNFIKSGGQFKIWAIAGPSGSGKTRLAYEWAYDSEVLKDWDCRVLHKEDLSTPKKWENWSPDKPTLIIIDYLYGFEEVVLELMNRRSTPTKHKIRLLLIDHVFSKPLHSDKRWGFTGDQESFDRNEKFFYNYKPLDLERTENQEVIIKSIIAERVGIDTENKLIDEAHDYLLNTEGAYRPLFAALIADAINSGKDFKVWNRRELINYYLSGEKHLPWEHEDLGLNGRWASHFIAAATARRGVAYKGLKKAAGKCKSRPKHFAKVKEICQKIVTDKNPITLKPFEPDILGESFFLKFLQFIEDSPDDYLAEFQQVFMAGGKDKQTKDAIEFIAFIQRLTRNLLNDDKSQEETQELWKTLFNFICPLEFEYAEPIRWALTAGLIDIVDAIKDQFSKKKRIALLNKIDPVIFYHVHNLILLEKSVFYSMLYFELTSKLTKTTPELSKEMLTLFDRYAENNADGGKPLILASYYGLNEIIKALNAHGVDIGATLNDGQNALMMACLVGKTRVAKQLISAGVDIHAVDNNGFTALTWAITKGHVKIVKLLLDEGADTIHTTIELTGLTIASACGHIEIIKLLLDRGADIHAAKHLGRNALIYASRNGHIDVAKLLLGKGAEIEATDIEGRTALIYASNNGHTDVVKLLLDKGAEIDTTNNYGLTALFCASFHGHTDVAKLLLDEGADTHATNREGHTALIWASRTGNTELVELLLDNGADINASDIKGSTALIWAITMGHIDLAKLLLDKGAEINTIGDQGRTALICAITMGHIDLAKLLLDKGANIDAAGDDTALNEASLKGYVEIVKLLLDKGANIHAADNEDCTALICASITGHIEIVKLLLDEGADIHAADNEGRTALICACENGHTNVAKLLLDKGADIHAADNDGWTTLVWAITENHVDVIKLLLEKGAEIDAADNDGCTALILASLYGHVEAVKLLLDKGSDIHATSNEGHTALNYAGRHVEIVKLLIDEGAEINAVYNE